MLDTIHIYNRALSDSEVETLYVDEATGMAPTVSVVVKTIRVNMMQLVPGQSYQLETSTNPGSPNSWTNSGAPFTATTSTAYQDIDIIGTSEGYYRVVALP